MIPKKYSTKPEDISPGIKTKPQPSPGLPENSSENSALTVRKKSQKFSLDCPKIVPKIQLGLFENSPENS